MALPHGMASTINKPPPKMAEDNQKNSLHEYKQMAEIYFRFVSEKVSHTKLLADIIHWKLHPPLY